MKTTGKEHIQPGKMEEKVKSQMFSLRLTIVIILIGYYAPAPILCVSMSTDVKRKAVSSDFPKSQWGVVAVAARQIPAGCTTSR